MNYELEWHPAALKEWKKMEESNKLPLKAKLIRRLEEPRIPKAALHNMQDCYKIKHGPFRLVYQVLAGDKSIKVLAVGHREKLAAYKAADARHEDEED